MSATPPPEGFERLRVVDGPVSIEIDGDGDALITSGGMAVLANRARSTIHVEVSLRGLAVSFEIPILAASELIVALSAAQSHLAMPDDPRPAA